ncbi:S-layer homology domain-containing protein, partial [Paenibacillus sepulcri]|nr:S-layer homology domain-containing protein [Paenibacillus sepulcri]
MKPDEEGSTVVQIADGIKEILLPANTADIAGIKKLELRSGTFSLAIDSIVLKELTKLVGGGELSDAAISITIEQASQEEAVSLLAGMEEGMGTLKAAGTIYHFGLSIVTKDGAARKLAVFEQPVELALPYDNEADESTLGVYFLNENDKVWEYAGGTVDGDGKVIKVKLSHFSTYAVLEYDKAFQDLPAAHWAFNAVRTLSARHVVNGVSATQFGPGTEVSRA